MSILNNTVSCDQPYPPPLLCRLAVHLWVQAALVQAALWWLVAKMCRVHSAADHSIANHISHVERGLQRHQRK